MNDERCLLNGIQFIFIVTDYAHVLLSQVSVFPLSEFFVELQSSLKSCEETFKLF